MKDPTSEASARGDAVPPSGAREASGAHEALLIAGLVATAFAVCYAHVVAILVRQWPAIETYSFGCLVPFISGYFIWLRRSHLRSLPVAPSFGGGGSLVIFAAALLLLGRVSAVVAFQEFSLVLMIPGLVLLLLGWGFLRALWFPLAYLWLMLPVWDVVTDPLHYPFQLASARLGLTMLRAVGIPAHLDQVYLALPDITLEVAKVCSGVNYLIAVIAIGVPLAYLFLSGWAPRLGLILGAIVIAFVSNGLRVALIGVFNYYGIGDNVHGPGHIFTGLFVSTVGYAVLLAGTGVLARWYPRHSDAPPATPFGRVAPGHGTSRSRMRLAGVCAVVLLVMTVAFRPEVGAAVAPLRTDQIPAVPGNWQVLASGLPARFTKGGTAEDSLARVYQAPTGERIELFVGSLTYSDPSSRLAYRSVELPRPPATTRVETADGRLVTVNSVSFAEAGREVHVVFWYDVNGRVTADLPLAKAYTALRLLAGQPPLARLVMVTGESAAGRGSDAELVTRFVRDLLKGAVS